MPSAHLEKKPPRLSKHANVQGGVTSRGRGSLRIAMICDFFHPVVGGVENHVYMLSATLANLGHKVIVITHSHTPDRVGIRHILPNLKVYYIPFLPIASSATLPNYFTFLPYFRSIVLRERVQIVHGHASLSSLAHEGILESPFLGLRTVFTDHSLFGFDDAATILTNKLLVGALANVDAVVCVSNTGRENTALRARLSPLQRKNLYVIPNAIIPQQFCPDFKSSSTSEHINIVVVSRLAYRKGIDLLIATAPRICAAFLNVRFLVGGDGPKLVDLLQMREKHRLEDRIVLLGSIRHNDVRDLLIQGSIYLNTSLTEAFGIGLLEAACAGLYVVSTRVGGVPEVLPKDMISFANPDEDDLFRALSEAVHIVSHSRHSSLTAHQRIKDMYSWEDVAQRTEKVYHAVLALRPTSLWDRIQRMGEIGPLAGIIYIIISSVQFAFLQVLDYLQPREDIDYVLT